MIACYFNELWLYFSKKKIILINMKMNRWVEMYLWWYLIDSLFHHTVNYYPIGRVILKVKIYNFKNKTISCSFYQLYFFLCFFTRYDLLSLLLWVDPMRVNVTSRRPNKYERCPRAYSRHLKEHVQSLIFTLHNGPMPIFKS